MTNFPVIHSTLSAAHLALFLQEKYGFNANTTCKLFRTGINHTYMVLADNTKYVFRIYAYHWRTETEIREELRLLNLLKENNLPVSYPIRDKQKKYIQTLAAPEGIRYGVLFSYAEGKKIRNLTEETCYRLGSLLAQMHQVTTNQKVNRIEYQAHTLTQLPYQYATAFFPETMPEMQFVKTAGHYLTSLFAGADTRGLRSGIVHLDLWYDNLNIQDDLTITLFDFDFCGNGWLLLDIAYFVLQLFNTEPDKAIFKSKSESFLQGYQAVTPIPAEEKRLLPYAGLATWLFYLGVQCQRFDNWSNIFLTENYLKHYLGLVKNWLVYNEIEIKAPDNGERETDLKRFT
jgi:Ser/Thr protein kinase RdoA (MazF antagonist)